jgi:phenylalanyl-tRNA synthetase alpha chain
MKIALDNLWDEAEKALNSVDSLKALEELRVIYLGKKGKITEYMKELKDVSQEERPKLGQKINQVKQALVERIQAKKQDLELLSISEQLQKKK